MVHIVALREAVSAEAVSPLREPANAGPPSSVSKDETRESEFELNSSARSTWSTGGVHAVVAPVVADVRSAQYDKTHAPLAGTEIPGVVCAVTTEMDGSSIEADALTGGESTPE